MMLIIAGGIILAWFGIMFLNSEIGQALLGYCFVGLLIGVVILVIAALGAL